MDSSSFAVRLAYARWLYHFRHGEAPSNAAIGKAADRTGQWVTGIADKTEPPTDYRVHRLLSEFFEVPEGWLFRNEGAAPMPALWAQWYAQRTGTTPNPAAAMGYVPRPLPPDRIEKETRDVRPTDAAKKRRRGNG